MKTIANKPRSSERIEQAWLGRHLSILWPVASFHWEVMGRGALVIDATIPGVLVDSAESEPRMHYVGLAEIAAQRDETSQRLARMVEAYDPARELVAAFIRPTLELSSYQIGVGEALVQAIQAADLAEGRINPADFGATLPAIQAIQVQFEPLYQALSRDLEVDSRV